MAEWGSGAQEGGSSSDQVRSPEVCAEEARMNIPLGFQSLIPGDGVGKKP